MGSPPRPNSKSLKRYEPTGLFAETIMAACFKLSASPHTRRAYWNDARHWLEFCDLRGVDPAAANDTVVALWVEEMRREDLAPKTRSRRIAALSSIYEKLRRDGYLTNGRLFDPPRESVNPFSVKDGPKRERATALNPTRVADPRAVCAAIAACDDSPEGIRDAAILRILWATGARRSSLTSMTFQRIHREREGYTVIVTAKGGKQIRMLIPGRAAAALDAWIAWLNANGIARGPIWRATNGATLVEKDIWRIVRRRSKEAGLPGALTPHEFRVAFLTLNPADLAAKQDAAGHSDPSTTRQYDRNWRGRSAFESMPEVEDIIDGND